MLSPRTDEAKSHVIVKELYNYISENIATFRHISSEYEGVLTKDAEKLYKKLHAKFIRAIKADTDVKVLLEQYGFDSHLKGYEVMVSMDLESFNRALGSLYLKIIHNQSIEMVYQEDSNSTSSVGASIHSNRHTINTSAGVLKAMTPFRQLSIKIAPDEDSPKKSSGSIIGRRSSDAQSSGRYLANGRSPLISPIDSLSPTPPFTSALAKQQSKCDILQRNMSGRGAFNDFQDIESPHKKKSPMRNLNDSLHSQEEIAFVEAYFSNLVISYLLAKHKSENLSNVFAPPVGHQPVIGCIMIVDISGFTKFSSNMCSKGAGGLDQLHSLAESFFQIIINRIYEYDGDVVAFAGDALICLFQNDGGNDVTMNSVRSCVRAINCAIAVAEICTDNLTSHIGISHGTFHVSMLGEGDLFTPLLTGQCIKDLSNCLDTAKSKQVAVTKSLYDLVASANTKIDNIQIELTVDSLSSLNCYVVRSISYNEEALKLNQETTLRAKLLHEAFQCGILMKYSQYLVPRPIMSALLLGSAVYLSELREITTMFLSLDTFQDEFHDNPVKLQPLFQIMSSILAKTGGFLRQFLVDDKGCVLIAFWGVSSYTFNNNSNRALFCAALMKSQFQAISHKVSVGLTTGDVYCGNLGSPVRNEFVGIGAPVNLAARFMAKGNGKILLDAATYHQLPEESKRKCQMLEKIQFKGVQEAIAPYQYVSDDVPDVMTLDGNDTNYALHILLKRHTRSTLTTRLDKVFYQHRRNMGGTAGLLSNMKKHVTATDNLVLSTIVVGSGIEYIAAKYYKSRALQRGFTVIHLKCTPGDELLPYGTAQKLLDELIRIFNSNKEDDSKKQQDYHNSVKRKENLEAILAILYKDDLKSEMESRDSMMVFYDTIIHRPSKPTGSKSKIVPLGKYFCALVSFLLHNRLVSLIIEDAHLCDELSWTELHLICASTNILLSNLFTMQVPLTSLTAVSRANRRRSSIAQLTDFVSRSFVPSNNGPDDPSESVDTVANNKSDISTVLIDYFNSISGNASDTSTYKPCAGCRGILLNGNSNIIEMKDLTRAEILEILQVELKVSKTNITAVDDADRSDTPSERLQMTISDTVVDAVMEVSGGNPYWTNAVVKFIRDNGSNQFMKTLSSIDVTGDSAMLSTDASYKLRNLDFKRANSTKRDKLLKRLIAYQMDKIDSVDQTVIKHCAVIGEVFDVDMLAGILPSNFTKKRTIDEILESLASARFIYFVTSVPNKIFRFQISLIQNTIYELIPPSDAQTIHQSLCDFIETNYKSNIRSHYATLSLHYNHIHNILTDGSKQRKAFQYSIKAGDQCVSRGAYSAGAEFIYTTLQVAQSIDDFQVLARVVECALIELRGFSRRISLVARSNNHGEHRNDQEIIDIFTLLKNEIHRKLVEVDGDGKKHLENVTSSLKLSTAVSFSDRQMRQRNSFIRWTSEYFSSSSFSSSSSLAEGEGEKFKYCIIS